MGKTTKKSEAGGTIKGQTSLSSFFTKKTPAGQSKLFTQVLPGTRPPSALSRKDTVLLDYCKTTDDDSDFQPQKKRKSPLAAERQEKAKPGRIANQSKDGPSVWKPNLVSGKSERIISLESRHRQQVRAEKTAQKDESDNHIQLQARNINIQKVDDANRESSDVSLALTSDTKPAQYTKATACSKPSVQASGYYDNNREDALQESQGPIITVIPETPEAVLNLEKTKTRTAHSLNDDLTPTRNVPTAFPAFVPETPLSGERQHKDVVKSLPRLGFESTPKRGGVSGRGVVLGRNRVARQQGENVSIHTGKPSSLRFLGKSVGASVDGGRAESPDLLQEMLEEFAQSAQPTDCRKGLPAQPKSHHREVSKSQGLQCKSGESTLNVGSKGLVSAPKCHQDPQPTIFATDTQSVLATSPDLKDPINPSAPCGLDISDKQDIDPLEEMLQQYAASSPSLMQSSECNISAHSGKGSKTAPSADRQVLQAKRSSKLSRTFWKKRRSVTSPVKTVNLTKAELGGILFGRNAGKLDKGISDQDKELNNTVCSTDKVDLICDGIDADSISGCGPLEEDLLGSSTLKKSANPFALKPSRIKLKAAVLHKPGSSHSKLVAFKTRLNTRKRSPCKGSSPYAKRVSTSHTVPEAYNFDLDITTKENSPLDKSERSPRRLHKDDVHVGTAAKKMLFQEDEKHFSLGLENIEDGSPVSSDASPKNLVDRTNIYNNKGTGSPANVEKNSPNAVRLQMKPSDFGVDGITKLPERVTVSDGFNEITGMDRSRGPVAALDNATDKEDLGSGPGTDALWEGELDDSLLVAMDMENLEADMNSESCNVNKGTGSLSNMEKNSPNAVRLQMKPSDFGVDGITKLPERVTVSDGFNEITGMDWSRGPVAALDNATDKEDLGSGPGTDALWEGELDDSLLAAMDMENLEADMNSEGKPDSMDSEVTRNFSRMSPFKNASQQKKEVSLPADLNRYRVTGIQDGGSEKVLQLHCLTGHKNKVCILKGIWLSTLLEEGDTVAVHGRFDSSGMCTVDQQNNFLVVHPNLLLTGTNVSRSIRCMRRSVLSEKFKGMDRASKPMLLGTILHDVFDKAVEGKNFSEESLQKIVDNVSHQLPFLRDMYAVGMTEQNVLDEAQEYVGTMKQWADRYLQPNPKQSATVDVKMPGQNQNEKCNVCIPRVKEIEETVWSPRWGTKGKVDLTVEVKIHQRKPQGRKTQLTVPLELKTGRQTNSIEHRSQLVLYSLMLGDIQDGPPSDLGLLLYLKTGAMLAVPVNHMDKRELVHLRNQLAYFITLRAKLANEGRWALPRLPSPIEDDFTCGYCPHLVSCALLQRVLDSHLDSLLQMWLNKSGLAKGGYETKTVKTLTNACYILSEVKPGQEPRGQVES